MRHLQSFISLAVLLTLAAPADAGPARWSYTATVTGETGKPGLDLGVMNLWEVDPNNGDLVVSHDYYITGPLPYAYGASGIIEGSRDGVPLGGIGHQTGAQFSLDKPAEPLDERFRLKLEIFDHDSGEAGTAFFLGSLNVATWWNEYPTPYEYSIGLSGDMVMVLGRNRYEISVDGGYTEDNGIMTASITVVPGVPEPATLALAAAGLLGGWVVRRRRRA